MTPQYLRDDDAIPVEEINCKAEFYDDLNKIYRCNQTGLPCTSRRDREDCEDWCMLELKKDGANRR